MICRSLPPPKIWGKKPKAATKVTPTSHQLMEKEELELLLMVLQVETLKFAPHSRWGDSFSFYYFWRSNSDCFGMNYLEVPVSFSLLH